MAVSIYRPNCYQEFLEYKKEGVQIQCKCVMCGKEFSDKNVRTTSAWRETQISGYCQNCWDEIFKDDDEGVNDDDD